MKNQKLLIEQMDHKISGLYALSEVPNPRKGWVNAIRTSLKMSLRQMGTRMSITAQSAADLEKREIEGTISINALKKAAEALDLRFVYAIVPKDGSIKNLIEKRAEEIAKEIVMRTSNSMSLEDQEVSYTRIKKAIKSKTEELVNEMPKYLWD